MKNKNLIEAKFLELMALVNLYIEPERTNIVKKAYSYAKKQHAEMMWTFSKTSSIPFYESCGFEKTGQGNDTNWYMYKYV